MTLFRRLIPGMMLGLILAGCGGDRQPLQVGGGQSPQNRIVAELVAQLASEADIPVQRRIGLADSRLILEALKRGEIDIYPEYTSAGLALLGLAQPPAADPDVTLGLLRERFTPMGLAWSDPLGFENRPGFAMLGDRAASLGIRSYSDLARHADRLALGVDSEFRARPVDGLAPLSRRYGMQFQEIIQLEGRDRAELYDQLIDGDIDVALVRSADPQTEVFDLQVLEDDLDFFSRHDAALVYRQAALQRFPALAPILAQLSGEISDEQIRALSRRVMLRGEDPRKVVRAELIRLGLVDGEVGTKDRQALSLAVSFSANADGEAGKVLRQLRRSFPTSNVNLVRSADPLNAIKDASVRLALVSAPAFFSPGSIDSATGQPPLRSSFEAVALVGASILQAFALKPYINRLEDADVIATGPVGSSGYSAARSIIHGLELPAALLPVDGDTPGDLADALIASGADIALLMQPAGNSTALTLLERGLSLIEVHNWNQGNNRIAFPYLQPGRLVPADYAPFVSGKPLPGLSEPVETLVTQLVLAGPAPTEESALGAQGPGASFIPRALPLTDQAVERINAAMGRPESIYPVVPQARALAPRLPQPAAPLNPSPAASVLSLLAIAMLIWMAWLLFRPEQPE